LLGCDIFQTSNDGRNSTRQLLVWSKLNLMMMGEKRRLVKMLALCLLVCGGLAQVHDTCSRTVTV